MKTASQPEVWLRGPVEGISPSLQPVAHALLQALEDVERLASDLHESELWTGLGGAASIGFHLRHLTGSLDRLFTYARNEPLSDVQRTALHEESQPNLDVGASMLIAEFRRTVAEALAQLRSTDDAELDAPRGVGRAGLPSSVRGLLYHAGEHSTRHAGQISTTVRILRGLRQADTRPAP